MSGHDRERTRVAEAFMAAKVVVNTAEQWVPPLPAEAYAMADVALRVLAPAAETTTGTVGADERVVQAARALVELHDDPMLCNTGGPNTVAAIDKIRQALAASQATPVTIRTVDDLHGLPAGTVLRLMVSDSGLGILVERDDDMRWIASGAPMPPAYLVGATVLHVPGRGAGGITRERVVEAVRWVVPVPSALRDKPGAAEAVADRLGLVETERGDRG